VSIYARLHGRRQGRCLDSAVAHLTAGALYFRSGDRTAPVLGVFETAAAAAKMAESVEPLESWLARDGHLDYLAELFFGVMRPEPEEVEYDDGSMEWD